MARIKQFKFVAAIRITNSGDTIGIPLFETELSNAYFTVETDHYLRITRFNPMMREKVAIERIDEDEFTIPFEKGDYVPLPVWVSGEKLIFSGGLGPEELGMEIPEHLRDRTVMKRLTKICARARRKEFTSQSENRTFWEAWRYLFQTFSGGSNWVSVLASVIRQMDTYLEPDSIEYCELEAVIERWIDIYNCRASHQSFEFFLKAVHGLRPRLSRAGLLIAVSIINRLLCADNTDDVTNLASDFSEVNARGAVNLVALSASTDAFASRHFRAFESKTVSQIERSLEARSYERLIAISDAFGKIALPNHIKYVMPAAIEREIRYLASLKLTPADYRDHLPRQIEAMARLVGGQEGVTAIHSVLEKRLFPAQSVKARASATKTTPAPASRRRSR